MNASKPPIRRLLPLLLLAACQSAVPVDSNAADDTGTSASPSSTTDTSTGDAPQGTTTAPNPSATDPSIGDDTTATTSSDGDPSNPGCGAFLCVPDGGGNPIECDTFEQDCPRGQKCAPWAGDGRTGWNATRCVPVDPDPDGIDEPCTGEGGPFSGLDTCEVGALCFNVDPDTNEGVCTPLCTGSVAAPTCEDPHRICRTNSDAILNVCIGDCDPLIPDECPEGDGCYPVEDGFLCVSDASGMEGGPFEPCNFPNACDPGLFCLPTDRAGSQCDPDASGCCSPVCDLSDPDCPEETVCESYFEDAPVMGYEDLGVCVTPS